MKQGSPFSILLKMALKSILTIRTTKDNKEAKDKESINFGKEEVKLFLFTDGMIHYGENLVEI